MNFSDECVTSRDGLGVGAMQNVPRDGFPIYCRPPGNFAVQLYHAGYHPLFQRLAEASLWYSIIIIIIIGCWTRGWIFVLLLNFILRNQNKIKTLLSVLTGRFIWLEFSIAEYILHNQSKSRNVWRSTSKVSSFVLVVYYKFIWQPWRQALVILIV